MTKLMVSKRTKATVLALLVNAGSAASQHAEPIQSYDSYQSWFVVCDNTLSCVAKGFDDTSGGAEIRIEREAGASGALVASISSVASFVPHDIKIDGAPGGLHGAEWKYKSSQGGSSLTTNDFATVRTLVQQLRNASKVTMGEATVPLNGFSAAVLRLDDRQGRIGGETALLKTGLKAASDVPAAPLLPHIPSHPIPERLMPGEDAQLIALVRSDQKAVFLKEECGDTPQQPEAYALDQAQALVLIPCIMGAYQGSSLAFIAQRGSGQAQRLIAPMPYLGNDPDRANAAYVTEGSFDAERGMLSMAAKGRGLADCGMSASWIWDGGAFLLSEMSLQQSCGGIEPGDWPTLFRSRQ